MRFILLGLRCFAAVLVTLSALSSVAESTNTSSTTASGMDIMRHCEALPSLTGSIREQDQQRERAFCEIDFNSSSVALCPKLWSTSPGAAVYDLAGTEWEGRARAFEQAICLSGKDARKHAKAQLAIFKTTLNGHDTSGTFAPSSLLYYHFSRLLQTRIVVPVAVMAEFHADKYRQHVVAPALTHSTKKGMEMLHAGWVTMDEILADPTTAPYKRELISGDNQGLWGIFLLQNGHRYGIEINGTRASGWGDGQNFDFQKTAPFIALRTDKPLAEAVDAGIEEARKDPKMAQAKGLPEHISRAQVAWWMNDITELVILDTLLGQQDRVGNIDYLRRWVWLEDEALQLTKSEPEDVQALPLRITVLNDNDAGVRSGYANYSVRTDMFKGWHHMDAGLYQRLQRLGKDFEQSGPVATAVSSNYRLSRKESDRIIKHGIALASQLRQRCEAGDLRFDLGVKQVLSVTDAAAPQSKLPTLDC